MKKRSCYLFLFEGFADWEPSLGAAMIEFAYKIFVHFEIMKKDELSWCLNLYKSGGMAY